ncbi:MAG: HlyD family efflux transporter periplasmic adaptor subunit, partial [Anaerolineales bacterium]|nr:HlyD family efflux transporter periplasmic adaptor subunit [Anaerolineales bacterium]
DDLSTLIVDVQVSEVDINHIRQNQPVIFTFDSILAKEYQGKVLEVPPVGEVQAGVTNFTVQVEISDADEQIKPGMTSAITFVVDEIEDVLLVPSRAIRIYEGQRVVYILQDGQLTPIEVVLGESSDIDSQVLEGNLQPGEKIVLNPPSSLPERGAGFEHPSFIGE